MVENFSKENQDTPRNYTIIPGFVEEKHFNPEEIKDIDKNLQKFGDKVTEGQAIMDIIKSHLKNGELNLSEETTDNIKKVGTYILKNHEKFNHLKTLIIPEKIMDADGDEEAGLIMVRIYGQFRDIVIKTDSGFTIPRPPDKL